MPPGEARSAPPPVSNRRTPASFHVWRGGAQSKIVSRASDSLPNPKSKIQAAATPAAPSAAPAFTLIEILLVLAIAAMMTLVFAVGYSKLADTKPATPDDVFWNAVTAARKQALLSGREVRLSYMPATSGDSGNAPAGLIMTWDNTPPGNAATIATDADPVPPGEQQFPFEKMGDIVLEFLSTQKGTQSILVGGEVVETQTIPYMTFYADGTCTPVRIQIRRNAGTAYTLAIDPWTCAQMLTAASPPN